MRDLKLGQKITIGKPIDNTEVYVLDLNNNLMPMNSEGELCVSGIGVARGYLNRPDITSKRFVSNPFHAGQKMYKTGDLVKLLTDGNIEFLGRIDDQVKIRGYRIELGEIESELLNYPLINKCVVIIKENLIEEKSICAYFVAKNNIDIHELRQYLLKKLPIYAVPSYFMQLEELPLTPNGKINAKSLPTNFIELSSEYFPPRNEIEQKLANAWERVLKFDKIGITDNFFEIGGDSISAIQVVASMQRDGYILETEDIFKNPTIIKLSNYVSLLNNSISQSSVKGEVNLTPIQKWFFELNISNKQAFTQSIILKNSRGFNEKIIEKVFRKISIHHDALRMTYKVNGNIVTQSNQDDSFNAFSLRVVDLRNTPEYETVLRDDIEKEQNNIDITRGPLVRLILFNTFNGDYLAIVIHHLVIDGVSWRIIIEDFSIGYKQAINNQDINFQAKTTSFKEWTQKLYNYANSNKLLKEINYWEKLEQISFKQIPKDYLSQTNATSCNNLLTVELSKEETSLLLKETNRAYNTEIPDILLTSLGLAFKNWTGENIALINLEGHGREKITNEVDLSRTVGWFTSVFPVFLDMSGNNGDISYNIRKVKETLRRIPRKGIGYGILKHITDHEDKNKLKFNLNPEINFNYLGQSNFDTNSDVFDTIKPIMETSQNSNILYGLDIMGIIEDGVLKLIINYNSSQYMGKTIQKFAENLITILKQAIMHCIHIKEPQLTPSDFGDKELLSTELEKILTLVKNNAVSKIYKLSPMQEGMLFYKLKNPSSDAYFQQISFNLKGNLNVKAFENSFELIQEKFDVFRTIFVYQEVKNPRQVVLKNSLVKAYFEDISNLNCDQKEVFLKNFIKKDKFRGFDLSKESSIRMSLLKTDRDNYRIIFCFHHIIMDGWCISIVFKELFETYRLLNQGEYPCFDDRIQYKEFIDWLREKDEENAAQYWNDYLKNYEQQACIPETKTKSNDEYLKNEFEFDISDELSRKLSNFAKKNSITINLVIQAIWGILLQRYNNTDDVVFGAVVSGRPPEIPGIEELVGLCINTIPIRIKTSRTDTFLDLLKQIQDAASKSEKYSFLSLSKIQSLTELKNNLINHILVFENYPLDEGIKHLLSGESFSNLVIEDIKLFEQTNYNFNIIVEPRNGLKIRLNYNSNIYDEGFIRRIKGHLEEIIKAVVEDPSISINEIDILTQEEKNQILYEFNDTQVDYPKDKTIHQLFEEQVDKTRNNIALVYEEKQLTYKELNARSNQLARTLREKGVKPDTIVAIMVERSFDMVVGILGILKSGGAYLPIDPEYPEERIKFMLKDSDTNILLTQSWLKSQVDFDGDFVILDSEDVYDSNGENLDIINKPNDLVYVIYTSGSTGTPKGVMIEHRNLVNLTIWSINNFRLTSKDRVAKYANFSFDASVWEVFPYIVCGATIFILDRKIRLNIDELNTYYIENKITVSFLPTQVCEQFIKLENNILRKLLTGGDKLKYFCKKNYEIINNYGPTENTVVTTSCLIDIYYDNIPIGKPISNTKVFILSKNDTLQPIGTQGEIYISGDGVSRGYFNRLELNNQKFIKNAYFQNSKLYKSGDLARWLPDGNIEFLGRIDEQVKIRGFRIELGEIISNLLKYPLIKQCEVITKNDKIHNKYLCAYIVSSEDKINLSELREFLKNSLPDYMIPSYFIQIEEMPLTQNGKVNKKELLKIDITNDINGGFEPARNGIEKIIVEQLQDIIEIKNISRNDSFFDLGLDSLSSVKFITKLSKTLEKDISLNAIFKYPTIKSLAKELDNNQLEKEISGETNKHLTCNITNSENIKMYSESLFDSIIQAKLPKVEAAALGYIPDDFFDSFGTDNASTIDNIFNEKPIVSEILTTQLGDIALIMLPIKHRDMYLNKNRLISLSREAAYMASSIGAKVMSLTGIIPSATNYGIDILKELNKNKKRPVEVTTGHTTTSASVVLSLKRLLEESCRNLSGEKLCVIGLGSIGTAVINLILNALPHPDSLILCDLFEKNNILESIVKKIRQETKFSNEIKIVHAKKGTLPKDIYDSTVIVGATNAPDILDINALNPGTLIVDDSAPHCFSMNSAISRLEKHNDILFTEGGVLESPYPIKKTIYLPGNLGEKILDKYGLNLVGETEITGCILSSILSSEFNYLRPLVGEILLKDCINHYNKLNELGFKGAPLHCNNYKIPEIYIKRFPH